MLPVTVGEAYLEELGIALVKERHPDEYLQPINLVVVQLNLAYAPFALIKRVARHFAAILREGRVSAIAHDEVPLAQLARVEHFYNF